MIRPTLALLGLAFLYAASVSAFNADTVVVAPEVIVQAGTATQANSDEFLAQSIVDEWWGSTSERRYRLLSRTYRHSLRTALAINNASDYDKAVDTPERLWGKRRTERVKRLGPDVIQVSVLVEWRQEGYEGVMTFVFDVIKEDGAWRIASVMH